MIKGLASYALAAAAGIFPSILLIKLEVIMFNVEYFGLLISIMVIMSVFLAAVYGLWFYNKKKDITRDGTKYKSNKYWIVFSVTISGIAAFFAVNHWGNLDEASGFLLWYILVSLLASSFAFRIGRPD